MAQRSKSPDQNMVRSSHMGVSARLRPWKTGLSVCAGPHFSMDGHEVDVKSMGDRHLGVVEFERRGRHPLVQCE